MDATAEAIQDGGGRVRLKEFLEKFVDRFEDIQIFDSKTAKALSCVSYIDGGGPGFSGDIEAYGDNIVYGVSAHISNDDVPYLAITLKDPEEE